MSVVADSSPLCHLARSGLLGVLVDLYSEVFVPSAVLLELSHPRAPAEAGSIAKDPPAWISIRDPDFSLWPPDRRLHRGEAASLSLAAQLQLPLIVDERTARDVASQPPWQVKITGTLGVLELAASRGLIVLPTALDRLMSTRFHLHPQLIESALQRDAARRRPAE